MTTNKYALSRSEYGWLMLSVGFLVSGLIYGLISLQLQSSIRHPDAVYGVLVAPILFLLSLSLGFALSTAGHYLVRVSRPQSTKEGSWPV